MDKKEIITAFAGIQYHASSIAMTQPIIYVSGYGLFGSGLSGVGDKKLNTIEKYGRNLS